MYIYIKREGHREDVLEHPRPDLVPLEKPVAGSTPQALECRAAGVPRL